MEQGEIVSEAGKYRSNLEHDLAALEAMVIRSDRLRQSILKRAFEGKLVPQDPEDEPAIELLARIQAAGEVGKEGPGKGFVVSRKQSRQ
jgi:type I restriction enzyme S subunit